MPNALTPLAHGADRHADRTLTPPGRARTGDRGTGVRAVGRTRRGAPYGVAAALFLAYAALSVTRHLQLRTTGYDLGIFEQAVRAYAELRAPVAELKGGGFNLLGDHFHPILALLAPAYRIFPSPITLLVAQAALLALSAIPVTRLAVATFTQGRHRYGEAAGVAFGLAYGLSWGIQQAVVFDFHEICFAVPLLAFALERLVRREWVPAIAWALPLVLVKEDLPVTVAAIGAYLVLRGQRRLGAALITAAVAAGLLILFVLIPAVNPAGMYPYQAGSAPDGQSALLRLLTPALKGHTVVMLLVPTLFLALRSPLLLIAVPTLAWRFWSTNGNYWGTDYHYSAILMPVVFIAALDALRRLAAGRPPLVARLARLAGPLALAIALLLGTQQPLSTLTDPTAWRVEPQAAAVRAQLAMIPDGASVAAANRMAPQLTARCQVYLFPDALDRGVRPDWIVVTNPPDVWSRGNEPLRTTADYETVADTAGIIILRRRAAS